MKEKKHIKNISATLSITGLVLLLLLSPCNVRKHLQSELGMPQTEASNKSKASVSTTNCNSQEISDAAVTISKTFVHSLASFSDLNNDVAIFTMEEFHPSIDQYASREATASFVPFYILYQNFQGYL